MVRIVDLSHARVVYEDIDTAIAHEDFTNQRVSARVIAQVCWKSKDVCVLRGEFASSL